MKYWLKDNEGNVYVFDSKKNKAYIDVDGKLEPIKGTGNAFVKMHPYLICFTPNKS